MWDEVTAKCGSVEFTSCVIKFINDHCEQESELILSSDNCAGQNKIINIVLVSLRGMHTAGFSPLQHVFLVPGYSYMPCDRDFGLIEQKLRKQNCIPTKHDYIKIIHEATHVGFEVVDMARQDCGCGSVASR